MLLLQCNFLSQMIRVESNTNLDHLEGFTEFEDDIHFDSDDPDFDHRGSLHDLLFGSKYSQVKIEFVLNNDNTVFGTDFLCNLC